MVVFLYSHKLIVFYFFSHSARSSVQTGVVSSEPDNKTVEEAMEKKDDGTEKGKFYTSHSFKGCGWSEYLGVNF